MPTTFEYMQFATGVYAASDKNTIGDPAGWTLNAWQPDTSSGFSAGYYFNSQTNEMVISYTGTNDWVDKVNWTTGIGLPLPQIFAAVRYYFDAKAAHPDANITFTGHSLGGGLASMMAVFFDKQATVFDEAPFQPAAMSPFVLPFLGVEMAVAGYQDAAFSTYLLSGGLLALTRESNVTQYYVEGEVLNTIRYAPNTLVGSDNFIPMGNSTAGAVDRHSMALMTALWQSPAFLSVVQRLPDLVTQLLDTKLFATDSTDPDNADLLRKLLRHQLGVNGAVQPDDMLKRFSADMNQIAQDGGMTMNDRSGLLYTYSNYNNISKALTAFAMQFYYEDTSNATDKNKQLFTDLSTSGEGSNGVRFDMHDVSKEIAAAMDANSKVDLTKAKGYQYFQAYLETTSLLTAEERTLVKSMLPQLRDWYIQAGASGMTATDTLNRGAFMLGGNAQDSLTGGTQADLLVGNAGDDILKGGDGSDVLIGGTDVDIYAWNASANAGIDTILDSDKQGYLRDDPSTGSGQAGAIVLTGGSQLGDNRVFSGKDTNGTNHIYTFVTGDRNSGGDLIVDGAMLIKDYNPSAGNHMGITLDGSVALAANDSMWRAAA